MKTSSKDDRKEVWQIEKELSNHFTTKSDTVKKFICEIKVQVDQKRLVVDSKRDVLKIFEDEVIKMND